MNDKEILDYLLEIVEDYCVKYYTTVFEYAAANYDYKLIDVFIQCSHKSGVNHMDCKYWISVAHTIESLIRTNTERGITYANKLILHMEDKGTEFFSENTKERYKPDIEILKKLLKI